jgi:hypothetical protein
MNDITTLMHSPSHILYVYLALWALSSLAHTMPVPDDKSGKGYQWFYNLLQFLLANLGKLQSFVTKPAETAASQRQA